jgi:hypothetical protein
MLAVSLYANAFVEPAVNQLSRVAEEASHQLREPDSLIRGPGAPCLSSYDMYTTLITYRNQML